MGTLFHSAPRLAAGFAHLATRIGLSCWAYLSNQQISEEWVTLAIAEAGEELRHHMRRSRTRRTRQKQ
jgi:hypothetical protein